MPNELLWRAATSLTSGISAASLNAGANLLGSEIDNTLTKDRWIDAELQFTCATATGIADEVTELYILYALDGTNYEDGGTSVDPTKNPVATFAAREVTSAQRILKLQLPVRPYKFKALLKSELSQNATSVTLTLKAANEDLQAA